MGRENKQMKRKVIIHWTGGTLIPNDTDREHYHYLVGYKDGKPFVEKGKYTVEDNDNCYDGKYAQHCGGGNTGAIGIAICGMHEFKGRNNIGNYPFTQAQYDKTCRLIAEVCRKYNILIRANNVMTHYEFGKKNPKTSSYGKIDITFLPFEPEMPPDKIGEDIRTIAQYWYLRLYGNNGYYK